jgi:dephospho-CoA kinase
VARRAFATPEDREWLEGMLWPRVGERMWAWREEQAARDPAPRALVVEVPLLFESGMDAAFDATVAVVADEAVRRERAGRGGTSRSTSAPRASSPRRRKPPGRRTRSQTPGRSTSWSRR